MSHRPAHRHLRRHSFRSARCLLLAIASSVAGAAHGQISLTTSVDMALTNSPRVQSAQAEVARARAALSESKDVYLPAISGGAGLGDSFGYTPNPPTLFTFASSSLVYNAAQFAYIRAARAALSAANLQLEAARQSVAADAALTFLAFQHDIERVAVLDQQGALADRLVAIIQDRLDAGDDTEIDLTQARLTAANLRLGRMITEDNLDNDRAHLARMIHLPAAGLTTDRAFPAFPALPAPVSDAEAPLSPGVAAAFANARVKQQIALGDSRYFYRPQLSLFGQYNRYASFAASLRFLENTNADGVVTNPIPLNEEAFGITITVPVFDLARRARNRESAAEAKKALADAEQAKVDALDGEGKLTHSITELEARQEIAGLDRQMAEQQLKILEVQLNTISTPGSPQLTPKDEQNARIAERDKYLTMLDTTFQFREAEINLLRETGRLIEWLKSTLRPAAAPPASGQGEVSPT